MPHKRNPISSENLSGIARLLRGFCVPALESVALWHERDMSHSSVERVVFPDATLLAHYGLHRAAGVIECLEVREPQIRARVAEAGQTVFSGHLLLALVLLGVSREEAYRWIQAAAHRSLDEKIDFVSALAQTPEILARMRPEEVESLTSLDYQLRHVDSIYRKLELGGKSQGSARGGRSVAAARGKSSSPRLRRVRSE